MRTVSLATTFIVVAVFIGPEPVRAADPSGDINISVVQSMFRDTSPALAKVLARPLTNIITRQTGLTGGKVDVAADALVLSDQLKTGKVQLGVFHGYEFAWARKQNPNLIPLVVTVYPTGSPRACVVVHANHTAQMLSDLKGTSIAIPRGSRGHCHLYLDKNETLVPASVAPPANAEEALSAVVARTSPATVVDAAALVGYRKLQPGAFKNLRVLAESESFPQNVIAYQKELLSEGSASKLREALTDAHTTAAGKPLMALWNIVKFDEVPPDYDAQLERVARAYPAPVKPGGTAGSGGR